MYGIHADQLGYMAYMECLGKNSQYTDTSPNLIAVVLGRLTSLSHCPTFAMASVLAL